MLKNELAQTHKQLADHNQILSEASLGGGSATSSFGPDRIRTLVSMAQIAPIGLYWGNLVTALAL